MKKLLIEIFAMMLLSMGLVYGISGITRLILRETVNYNSEIIYHVSLIAGLCGLIFFAVLLNFLIIRRLKRLTYGVREVASGNYDVALSDKGIDEIHTLSNDFNRMARELKSNEYLNKEFVRNVSHELKTPLGNIMGYAQLMIESEKTCGELYEYAKIVCAEASRALSIGTQMLELSRLNSTQRIEKNDTFRADEQIRNSILSQQNQWTKKNIVWNVSMDECEISGNENLTYHIWQNLISNAIKFTEENGTVTVNLKKDDRLRFEISNTGKGIDPNVGERVFEQFFTLDQTNKGTGLGLPITKKIVEMLTGKIRFTSTEDKTTFFVEL